MPRKKKDAWFDPSDPSDPLYRRPLRRAPALRPLSFLEAPPGDWASALAVSPGDLDALHDRLCKALVRLPGRGPVGAERAARRRLLYPNQPVVLRTYALALSRCPELVHAKQVTTLRGLALRLGRYRTLKEKAAQAQNAGMDLRLCLAALQFHMLQRVFKAVLARLNAPDCSPHFRERLQTCFSRMLLAKQDLLLQRERRAKARRLRTQEIEAEILDIEQRTLIADTAHAVRVGRMPDRAVLERAAQALHELNARRAERGEPMIEP